MTLHAPAAIADSSMHKAPQPFVHRKAVSPHAMVSKTSVVHDVLQRIIFGGGCSFGMRKEDWTKYLLDEIFFDSDLTEKLLMCLLGNYPEEFIEIQESVDEIIYAKAKKQLAAMSFEELKSERIV